MKFSVAIRTITSRPHYLYTLCDRLVEAAQRSSSVVAGIHVNEGTGISPNENAFRAMEKALVDEPDWVMFFEDDADVLDDIFDSTARWLTRFDTDPRIQFYPLGCNYYQCFRPGLSAMNYPWSSFYGSVGLVIRPDGARDFIRQQREVPPWAIPNTALDINLARWHVRIAPEVPGTLTPVPCFIDHLGEVSTIRGKDQPPIRYSGFGGRQFQYHG